MSHAKCIAQSQGHSKSSIEAVVFITTAIAIHTASCVCLFVFFQKIRRVRRAPITWKDQSETRKKRC